MTWSRAFPVLLFCLLFDLVRAFFEWLGVLGPALIGTGFGVWASQYIGTTAGTAAGGAVAGGTAYFASGGLEEFGLAMGVVIGIAGWIVITGILGFFNRRIFTENAGNFLWAALAFGGSELPFVGSFLWLTLTTGGMYRTQIKRDRKKLKAWNAEEARLREREKEMQIAALVRARAQQETEDASSDDSDEIPEGAAAAV